MSLERLVAAGEGQPPIPKFMARLAVSLDTYIAEIANGDPAKAAEALHNMGMTDTAALFGYVATGDEPGVWERFEAPTPDGKTEALPQRVITHGHPTTTIRW